MRIEKDFIGQVSIPEDALYGIHAYRARDNFADDSRFNLSWYKSVGLVKKAVFLTYARFKEKARLQYDLEKLDSINIDEKVLDAIISSCDDVAQGEYFENFIVPAISGGAGTSINMNINEIIANAALLKMNKAPGDYQVIDPIEEVNLFQSTNDVIPTALKVSIIKELQVLQENISATRMAIENKEKNYHSTLRVAYTQMQEAVPSTYGRLFSNYQEMLSRDWWRVSKCFERMKVVNLGGSAIGTGMAVPRFMVLQMVETLRELTKLPVCRGDNLTDTTSNLDSLVEVHAILKAHAVNLEKMVSDLRLLGSDLFADRAVNLPKAAVGSSIMPFKVNPVIAEYVISCCHKVYSNDAIITNLSAQGVLDLNPYLPIIGDSILNSITLLNGCNLKVVSKLIDGLEIDEHSSIKKVLFSSSTATALIPHVGHHKATKLAQIVREQKIDIYEANKQLGIISEEKLRQLLQSGSLLKMGYSLRDLEGDSNGAE